MLWNPDDFLQLIGRWRRKVLKLNGSGQFAIEFVCRRKHSLGHDLNFSFYEAVA